jgi:benzoyl-CoA reductase subunit D
MITAGIDCGAKNTKTVILKDGKIIGKAKALTGFNLEKAAAETLQAALTAAGIDRTEVKLIFSTGSGCGAITLADEKIDEIKAMSKGAVFYFPKARTVTDVGAEEGRVARLDKTGDPVDFAINEKCAAGAGTFIETMGQALDTPVEEMGPLALTSKRKIPMNAQCAVFAESEVVGLIHAKTAKNDISRAIHDAMADRIVSMLRRIGIDEDVVMVGGVGRNPAVIAIIRQALGLETIYVPEDPEYGAAVGAAVAAAEKA